MNHVDAYDFQNIESLRQFAGAVRVTGVESSELRTGVAPGHNLSLFLALATLDDLPGVLALVRSGDSALGAPTRDFVCETTDPASALLEITDWNGSSIEDDLDAAWHMQRPSLIGPID